jgi:hypothetical protein
VPLIDQTTLLGIADRAAQQYNLLQAAYGSANVVGTDWYADWIIATDDPDVEIPTLSQYRNVDRNLTLDGSLTVSPLLNIIGAMETHFNDRSGTPSPFQPGGWDGYMITHDKRVSWWFNRLFKVAKARWMLAINVFSETDDEFADLEVVSGPAVSFVDGVNYGNGSDTNLASGTDFAATQLKVVVTTMGAVDLDLRIGVKDKNNLPTTVDVTVPANSIAGAEIAIGSASSRFLDVISAGFVPSGDKGSLGDKVTIRNLKERQISL